VKRLKTAAWPAAAIVVSFAVVLGCTVAAGKLLSHAWRPDGSTPFDSSITSWMVDHRTHPLTVLARVLSAIGSQKFLTPAVAIVVVLLLVLRRFGAAAWLVVAWGGAILLYSLAKHFVGRPRPPMDIWLTHAGAKSFPSGHAVQSMSTYLALALVGTAWRQKWRWPAVALAVGLALGIGWSRVYLGVHWTTDVLAGWLMALAWIGALIALTSTSPRPAAAEHRDPPT
jgi:undecaprenyl-diphosphatase